MTEEIDVTAAPEAEAAPKKEPKAKKVVEHPCAVCGKPLTDDESIKLGIGPLCRAKGWTKEKIAERMAELKADAAPEGWMKLADLDKKCRAEGIPVARMVRAIGGDRAMEPPVDPRFKVVYVGRARYISPEAFGEEALNLLRDRNLGQPAPERKPRVKKEKPEGEGKPKKGKKEAKPEAGVTPVDVSEVWSQG